jgi:hypothetical protein
MHLQKQNEQFKRTQNLILLPINTKTNVNLSSGSEQIITHMCVPRHRSTSLLIMNTLCNGLAPYFKYGPLIHILLGDYFPSRSRIH